MPSKFASYRRYGNRNVQGWMHPPVLDVIAGISNVQAQTGIRGGVAEIGVHHGRLFIGLHLLAQDGEGSIAFDLFDDQDSNTDRSGRGDREVFERKLDRFGRGSASVQVVAGDSIDLNGPDVKKRLGSGVRLFSVDGGHTAGIVKHDMQTAQDSLVDGGVVIADDVFNAQWPGVAVGTVDYLTSGGRLVPFAIGFNKVFFTTAGFADTYRAAVASVAAKSDLYSKSIEFAGHGTTYVGVWDRPIKHKLRNVPGLRPVYEFVSRR